MAGDQLTARQTGSGYTVLGQHPLTDVSTGLYSKSTATSWSAQQTASAVSLPRCGKVGVYLIDTTSAKTLRVVDNNTALAANTSGVTLECVAQTVTTGYNFFGGIWERSICSVWGNSGYNISITLYPVNDAFGDVAGRARITISNIGGTLVSSRTVHSRPVISDGVAHHLALTHAQSGTSSVAKMYVDGTLVETVSTSSALSDLTANSLTAGVDDYFTGFVGSVSHLCLTGAELAAAEVKSRASLVVNLPTSKVLAWDATSSAWRVPRGRSSSSWFVVKPPS